LFVFTAVEKSLGTIEFIGFKSDQAMEEELLNLQAVAHLLMFVSLSFIYG
jgi:hypothetical protein